jgi:hypothetical protein
MNVGDAGQVVQLYDPPQNVIMSGTLPTVAGTPVSFHSRLARNMEPGDMIVFLCRPIYAPTDQMITHCDIILNYVQTFN